MQRFGWTKRDIGELFGALDTGGYVKYADAEEAIRAAKTEGRKYERQAIQEEVNAAVQKEREEIIGMFGDIRRSTVPSAHLTELDFRIRSRGEQKPGKECKCYSPASHPDNCMCECHKKPGKIEKIPECNGGNYDLYLTRKINELIDAENARREK